MIEHTFKGFVVRQIGASFVAVAREHRTEADAHAAIDKIIAESLGRPDDEPASADAYECACAEAHTDRRQCAGYDPWD
jgi:hypothetical protein